MGQILDKLQETQRLQEAQYLGIREDLKDINTTLVTIAGVLADKANTMRDSGTLRAPDTSHTDEQPSISADASGQEALPQEQQATSTPPPAEGEPLSCSAVKNSPHSDPERRRSTQRLRCDWNFDARLDNAARLQKGNQRDACREGEVSTQSPPERRAAGKQA
ncbi:hypothetical protein NDU88_001944 [Pleurodeles waltl]|uniref:Uncharacterized protein n=1 Tax=Pleurodeles waltl TaxID=8319 RepID=A0AAV7M4K8_PLEWA|nr:hypothetical protein NDU88_001944 [Pleurodeles waltl]